MVLTLRCALLSLAAFMRSTKAAFSFASSSASHRPAQAAIEAHGAQAIRIGALAVPAAKCLRAAQKVMGCLLGGYGGAVDQFQRWELLALRYSAAGVCAVLDCGLHWLPSFCPVRALIDDGFQVFAYIGR